MPFWASAATRCRGADRVRAAVSRVGAPGAATAPVKGVLYGMSQLQGHAAAKGALMVS